MVVKIDNPSTLDDVVDLWNQKPRDYPTMRYDEELAMYYNGVFLSHFGTRKVKILDACCGTGNPSLGLLALFGERYEVTFNDKSREMTDRLRENAAFHNVEVNYSNISWKDLPEVFGKGSFDGLLCVGNSLIYAASWESEDFDKEKARESVRESLYSFHRVLKTQGILILDTTNEEELKLTKPTFGSAGFRVLEEGRLVITRDFVIQSNHDEGLRKIINFRTIYDIETGKIISQRRYVFNGLWLPHEELRMYLLETGFKVVEFDRDSPHNLKVFGAIKYGS